MVRLLLIAAAFIATAGGGAWLGWRAGETAAAKREARAATQAVQDLTRAVSVRVAQQSADVAAEQARSVAWLAQKAFDDALAQHLSAEITHATFVLPPLPAGAASCTAPTGTDMLAAPEFMRLYDAAARAGQPAAAASAGHAH